MKRKEIKENQIEEGETATNSHENEEERTAFINEFEKTFNYNDLENLVK